MLSSYSKDNAHTTMGRNRVSEDSIEMRANASLAATSFDFPDDISELTIEIEEEEKEEDASFMGLLDNVLEDNPLKTSTNLEPIPMTFQRDQYTKVQDNENPSSILDYLLLHQQKRKEVAQSMHSQFVMGASEDHSMVFDTSSGCRNNNELSQDVFKFPRLRHCDDVQMSRYYATNSGHQRDDDEPMPSIVDYLVLQQQAAGGFST